MANEEKFVLDGLALNDGVAFGVTNVSWPPPRQRQEWIGAADSEAQLLVRDALHDNRKVTLRVGVLPQTTMDLALAKVALVLDKLQKASKYTDGIGLVWTPATATVSCTFDVLAGEITDLPIDWENGWLSKSPEFTVELTCKPYWRGVEVVPAATSASTPFVALEVLNVTGDVPALGRLIVTDTATQSRRHVEWGIEGPLTYNASTSLLIDSDSMVTSGFAGTQTTQTGAYDPNAAGNSVIGCTARTTPTAVCGTGVLAHVGTFLVKGRFYFAVSPAVNVRFSWQVGDGVISSNTWFDSTGRYGWTEVDLGTIEVPCDGPAGQKWSGRIEATTAAGTQTVYVDYLTLVPVSNGYGKARATYGYTPGATVAYDDFVGTTAAAALGTRAAPAGGSWASSGDTTDFVFDDNFVISPADAVESLKRSTGAAETVGRFAILGSTNYTDMEVGASVFTPFGVSEASVIARWVDSSNYLRFRVPATTIAGSETAVLETVIAGTVVELGRVNWRRSLQTACVLRLIAYASGRTFAMVATVSGEVVSLIDSTSAALATGGTLASGKPGLRDRSTAVSSGVPRNYTHVTVSTPPPEPIAIYSGMVMEINSAKTVRQDSTGTYTGGRPPSYRGARFTVPVGTSRVLVKARRNDIEVAPDDNVTDALQIQVAWTPRGLAVPR